MLRNTCKRKAGKVVSAMEGLQKAGLRRTDTQINKEEKFTADLDKLFDIAHEKALNLITIEEDRAFLLAQSDGRIGFLGPVDKELVAKEVRSAKRKQE